MRNWVNRIKRITTRLKNTPIIRISTNTMQSYKYPHSLMQCRVSCRYGSWRRARAVLLPGLARLHHGADHRWPGPRAAVQVLRLLQKWLHQRAPDRPGLVSSQQTEWGMSGFWVITEYLISFYLNISIQLVLVFKIVCLILNVLYLKVM